MSTSIRTAAPTLAPTLRDQAASLIAYTDRALRAKGCTRGRFHCLIGAPNKERPGWGWWIVGQHGEAIPATPTVLAALPEARTTSVWGWWIHRLIPEIADADFGAARCVRAEFVMDTPVPNYRSGRMNDLTATILFSAGETPAAVLWSTDDGPPGWPR
jgi:hypothetical protein